ncbi:MAG: hypothetical protein ABR520_01710 [Mycobacteriales bacterium]
MARTYAKVVGVVVLLVGIVGLFAGDEILSNFTSDIIEDIVHLVTGAALAYVGFAAVEYRIVRNVVGVLGIVYLLVGIIGFISDDLGGILDYPYTNYDNVLHLVLGILGIAAAYLMGGEGEGTNAAAA